MAKMRLLQRQISLLEYLTSNAAIFGHDGGAPLGPDLHGIEPGLLRLEARFSYEKRMEKIMTAFPRTFEILGTNRTELINKFIDTYPPTDISRLANARQFHDFLKARWRREPPDPPYLRDVAACELASSQLRAHTEEPILKGGSRTPIAPGCGIRRSSDVVLLRCAYDVRPLFESSTKGVVPIARDTRLAIAKPPDARHPQVFEVSPVVFDLLAALDHWTDPAVFGATPDLEELFSNLAEHGLIEVSA